MDSHLPDQRFAHRTERPRIRPDVAVMVLEGHRW